jgi:SsrA-binding protein
MINRKVKFEYDILDQYLSGVVLTGSEVKSLRSGLSNINDSYCLIVNDELFIRNMYIGKYEHDNSDNIETRKDRKLLVTKKELKKIKSKVIDKGITIIPLEVKIDKLVKVKIGICKGKKLWDKRESIKNRENDRTLKRMKL